MATTLDSYKEVCLIGIIPEGDTEVAFGGITQDITGMDFGDKDITGEATVSGGRIINWTPQADETITMKLYPVTAGVDAETTATGVTQLFHPQSTADSTNPIAVDNTRLRKKFGIILLWSTALGATAGALPVAGVFAFRIQIINAYMTSWKPSFDDKSFMGEGMVDFDCFLE